MEKTWGNTGMAADKSQKQRRGDCSSKEWGQKSSFCVIDGSLSNQEFGVGAPISKSTEAESHSEVTLWKMTLVRMQCSLNKDHQRPKWQPQKSWTTCQAADAVTRVKMEDASTLLKIPKSECPDIWIRGPKHKWPKSWSSLEDPVVPLESNLYGHPPAGL